MKLFEYNTGKGILPEGHQGISPSQLSRFFDDGTNWYRETLMGEAPVFQGNTATHLGTCVHVAAEMYTNTGSVDHSLINNYINSITDVEVDKHLIRQQYPTMASTLISAYLSKVSNTGVETEKYVYHELLPNIYVKGSIDRYDPKRRRIVDFKTMGSLDSARVPTSFSRAYWFQQMAYAWMLSKKGTPIDYLELVFVSRDNTGRISEKTGKPMKDYPSEVNSVIHEITTTDMEIIDNTLQLVAHSIQHWNDNPDHRYLLAKDWRLYNKPKVKPLWAD